MTGHNAEAFIARVQDDPEFADRLIALREDPAAVQALIAKEGFEATPEQIRDVFIDTFGSELSEEKLAAIAGGQDPFEPSMGAPTFGILDPHDGAAAASASI